jgi:hypothetical protein
VYANIVNIYSAITNNKKVKSSYLRGKYIDIITFFKVGYRKSTSDKWNVKKNGCTKVAIIAKVLYVI